MKTPLLPTQVVDVARIEDGEDIPNFSEPGTGKTLTTVGAIHATKMQSGLIICPTIATIMWQRVLSDELGAKVQRLDKKSTPIDKTADFIVLSYGLLDAHFQALMDRENGALVLDESHYLKSSEAQRTQAVFGPDCDGSGGLYETSEQCWILTGTPVERYADDLWSQLRATQPEVLQRYRALSLAEFQSQFCQMRWKEFAGGRVRKYVSDGNMSARLLNTLLYDADKGIGAIRRTLAEVDPHMPPVKFRDVYTPAKIGPELKSLLVGMTQKDIEDALYAGGDKIVIARRLMGMAKIKAVIDYIKEQASDHPVLVGFWHDSVGRELLKQFKAVTTVGHIDGSTSPLTREKARQAFINGEIRILLGQIYAAGVAMDGLQDVSNHVIFAELEWSWAKMEQFYKRLHRKGQKLHVQVDFCSSLETVDTALYEIAHRKRVGAEEIIG